MAAAAQGRANVTGSVRTILSMTVSNCAAAQTYQKRERVAPEHQAPMNSPPVRAALPQSSASSAPCQVTVVGTALSIAIAPTAVPGAPRSYQAGLALPDAMFSRCSLKT